MSGKEKGSSFINQYKRVLRIILTEVYRVLDTFNKLVPTITCQNLWESRDAEFLNKTGWYSKSCPCA